MINYLKKIYYEKYSKKSYSLSNVDLIIERIFKKKDKGIFIDVGCNHPIKYNNTYLLYKKGWSGINIDLDTESINQFNKLRTRDINIQTLITSYDNEEKDLFYYHNHPIKYNNTYLLYKKGWSGINIDLDTESINQFNKLRTRDINIQTLITSYDNEEKDLFFYHDRSAINTISKDLANSRKKEYQEIRKLKGKSLNTIIENSKFKNLKIDLLSIDIENYEYEALKNFNFQKYDIDMIVTEITDTSIKNLEIFNLSLENIVKTDLYNLLINNNYKLVNWVNADLIFVKKNSKF